MNDKITQLMQQAIAAGVTPGGVVGYCVKGHTEVLPFGRLTYDQSAVRVTHRTRYDLASITKAIPTATLLLQLIEQKAVRLSDKVGHYIPELAKPAHRHIEVRHLLTYTVVFAIDELSAVAQQGGESVLREILQADLKAQPGSTFLYANAPAILAGVIVERVLGGRLHDLAQKRLFTPLHMTDTAFFPPSINGLLTAPTEINQHGVVQAEVHDEAAHALRQAGMVPGHAGLFSTAGDLLHFTNALLAGFQSDNGLFKRRLVTAMYNNASPVAGSPYGLGWEIMNPTHMGSHASAACFAKTGFTGSMVLVDPLQQRALVMLANATFPRRPDKPDAINAVRAQLADIVLTQDDATK